MNQRDTWYDINSETDILKLQEKVERDFLKSVFPYLNKIETRESLIYQLIIEGSDYLIAQIKTLYYNGQQERALNLLTQEYRGATEVMKKWLDDLKRELTE